MGGSAEGALLGGRSPWRLGTRAGSVSTQVNDVPFVRACNHFLAAPAECGGAKRPSLVRGETRVVRQRLDIERGWGQDVRTMKFLQDVGQPMNGEHGNAKEQKAATVVTSRALGQLLALGIIRLRRKNTSRPEQSTEQEGKETMPVLPEGRAVESRP